MRAQKGFSLVELLLVVAVILIIAAIAIPNLLRSRMAANEASAVASLRSIESAQVAYALTYPTQGFAPDLDTLGPGASPGAPASSTNALLLDGILGCPAGVGTASCQKSGYNFYVTAGSGSPLSSYSVNADPLAVSKTGQRYFFSDSSGVIRYNSAVIATVTDLPLQ
jgi:prepilin-type N-terminal cleavage/methylation domain-containing protein